MRVRPPSNKLKNPGRCWMMMRRKRITSEQTFLYRHTRAIPNHTGRRNILHTIRYTAFGISGSTRIPVRSGATHRARLAQAQKRSVQVINLVAEHTIWHRMLALLDQKHTLAEGVVASKGGREMALPSGRTTQPSKSVLGTTSRSFSYHPFRRDTCLLSRRRKCPRDDRHCRYHVRRG